MKKHAIPLEPGARFILIAGLILESVLTVGFLIYAWVSHGSLHAELSGLLTILVSLSIVSVLIFIPKLENKLKAFYTNLILLFYTIASLALPLLFLSAQNITDVAVSLWTITFSTFIPLTVVAIQYGFNGTLFYVLLANIMEIMLQLHAFPSHNIQTFFQEYNLFLVLPIRLFVMTAMGHILFFLVKALHENHSKLITTNQELETLNHELELRVQERTRTLKETNQKTLQGWVHLPELRNIESRGHSERVGLLATTLAEKLNRTPDEIEAVKLGALLHDVGELSVPDAVLLKPGRLTDFEYDIVKQHASYGYQILRDIDFVEASLNLVHYHHERYDGSGYPEGLKENEIPWCARLFAVVDVYDALTSKRPHRDAWTPDEAKLYLQNNAGRLFDPLMVNAFLGILEDKELDSFFKPKVH